ncbi:MAG: hypothetical protein Q8M37_10335 [Nevskia sp.]|nr:hypothetical protein [Nevskia sp.]
MNQQQQREEARRRRLINRNVAQHRQLYFDDARRGVVSNAGTVRRNTPRLASVADQSDLIIDSPLITFALKLGIVALMVGLLIQHQAALLQGMLSLLPSGLIG